jgi:hypothetical protein
VLRRFLPIVGATLLLLAAVGSSGAAGSGGIRKAAISTAAPILQLAADGTTVAAVVGLPRTGCGDQTLIWDIRQKTPAVMQGKGDSFEEKSYCITPYESDAEPAIAVGGGMVGVLQFVGFEADHIIESVLRVTRIPTNRRWTEIAGLPFLALGFGPAFAWRPRLTLVVALIWSSPRQS